MLELHFILQALAADEIYTSNVEGTNRVHIAGQPNHLYFGTSWSPDRQMGSISGLPERGRILGTTGPTCV